MRAVDCHAGRLEVVDLPDPAPGRGQLVLAVRRCGICGSDLHAKEHGDALAEVMDELGYAHSIRRDNHVVLGHEIVGEVVERGRGAGRGLREGDLGGPVPAGARQRRGAPDRAVAARPGRVRRAGARRGRAQLQGAQRPGRRDRGAHRADGGGAARGQPRRRGPQGRRGRAGLRPGRARGDPAAQGPRGASRRGLRLLRRPARAGPGLRRRHGRRPRRGVAVRRRCRGGVDALGTPGARPRRRLDAAAAPPARLGAPLPRRGRARAPPTSPGRSSSSASGCPG